MGSEIINSEVDAGFSAAGLNFKVITSDYKSHKTTKDSVVILKGADFLRSYDNVFASAPKKNVLEVGIFEGGSAIFWGLAQPDFKIVGIDIRKPDEEVLRLIHDLGLKDRVKIYYETSQSDGDALNRVIATEFGDEELGIIIDDASHNYGLSKRTFELTFGKLAAGGHYCLEDWAWAHWPGAAFQTTQWTDQPALSNLVFEFIMLFPSARPLIDQIDIQPNVVRVVRGARKIGEFNLDSLLCLRGKKLTPI